VTVVVKNDHEISFRPCEFDCEPSVFFFLFYSNFVLILVVIL